MLVFLVADSQLPRSPRDSVPKLGRGDKRRAPAQTSGRRSEAFIRVDSFGCSVHSNSKPSQGQKGVRSRGISGTCSAGTWDIGPWPSLVLSTQGCSARESISRRVSKRGARFQHHKPCGSCARTCQILRPLVSKVLFGHGCHGVSAVHLHKGQSSPGYLHVGHVPSKWTWQMPQTSSSGMSHRQVATAFHFLILTFIGGAGVQCVSSSVVVQGMLLGRGSSPGDARGPDLASYQALRETAYPWVSACAKPASHALAESALVVIQCKFA